MSLLDTASLIVTPSAYKEGKLYSVIPTDGSGDLSVTRATTATRVNSAGLVELVPYNLFTYSEQFDNAAWGKNLVTITSNATTAPNGTTTADKIIIDNGSQDTPVVFVISDSETSTRTLSFYAKASEYNIAYARIGGAFNAPIVLFSLTGSGSILHNQNASSYSIESVGNGWYRCSMTYAHGSSFAPCIGVCSSTYTVGISTVVTTGNGTSGIFIWGAQLNEGTLKDYQKTETRLNIPRLDYSNGTCPSILVEPQRTNLLKYSSSFDISPWTAIGTTITPNTQVAPDGTTTGDTYSTSQSILLLQTLSASPSTTYTVSMWVKLGTATNLCLVANNTAAWNTIGGESFDSADGLNTSTWTRIEWTFTTPSSLPAGAINFHIGGNAETGLTQSTGTVFIWGAQLEAGDYASSYIPTLGASVTRNADVISKTGISSLIGQTEGTLFFDLEFPQNQQASYIGISDGTTGNRIILGCESGTFYTFGYGFSTLSLNTNTRYKIAMAYNSTNMKIYANGTLLATVSGAVPSGMSRFAFDSGANTQHLIADVYACSLWKTKLTDTQLATLTTI